MKFITLYFFLIGLPFGMFCANNRSKIASVPFQVVGSYIVVEVTINGSSRLNLILDSGVSNTLITELTNEDALTLNYTERTQIQGLGSGVGLMAFKSDGNTLKAGKIIIPNQSVYVFEEDVFNLSKHVGSKINGLLGSDFFENHVVKIDYTKRVITFYDEEFFVAPKNFIPVPMIIDGHKMFISLPVTASDWTTKNALMLLDTGAELTAWFRSYGENPIKIPSRNIRGYIGQGLNGEIKGYQGCINQISIGGHTLHNPIVCFPDSVSITDAILASKREGTIGSQILSRFNMIFDQHHQKLYLKPNYNFKDPFSYNIAGIEIMQDDIDLQVPVVISIRENSPAERAGVQVGDRIFQINEFLALKTNINELKKLFEISTIYPLRLFLLREGNTLKINVEMKSEI